LPRASQVRILSGVLARAAGSAEGSPPVAVSASDLATRNLTLEQVEAASSTGQWDDVRSLLSDVVELEHYKLTAPAIDTLRTQE
jgi:hypothetical protein